MRDAFLPYVRCRLDLAPATRGERSFSVELKTSEGLDTISISKRESGGVLVEGILGRLERACFVEGSILEVKGSDGTLRVDLGSDELRNASGDGGSSTHEVKDK